MNRSSSCFPRRRAAFTLIELLVVIAIISVLAAILLPVFSTARESSRRASCASNQRQLAMAVIAYTQDWGERLPGSTDGPAGDNLVGGWIYYFGFGSPSTTFDPTRGSLFPFVKSRGVYTCLDDGSNQGDTYEINGNLGGPYIQSGLHPGLPLFALQKPADTFLFVEENANSGGPNDGYFNVVLKDQLSSRHGGGNNFSFTDGHVKYLKDVTDLDPRFAIQ